MFFLPQFLTFLKSAIIFRSRKTSITTGIVDRSELVKSEVDRLSPLTNTSNLISFPNINDPTNNDLEKYVEMDVDATTTSRTLDVPESTDQQTNANVTGNTRRHTVGPGDVAHEQALVNNPSAPINFKFGPENCPHLPINLPMLQNQPLHNFTIKNQHLLKPPTAMEASKLWRCGVEK